MKMRCHLQEDLHGRDIVSFNPKMIPLDIVKL